jgi:Tol biopolymer transport system component
MPHNAALTIPAYVLIMRTRALALLAALSVAVPAAAAPGRSEHSPMLMFKVVNMNGERRVLSRHAIDPYGYSLSPDHTELAYTPQTCTGCPPGPTTVAAVRSTDERVLAGPFLDLAWAPNGRQIALVGTTGSEHGLFLVKPDGSDFRHVANTVSLVWSPDSRFLAGSRPISVVSLATGEEQPLSQGYGPAWSPDGTRIAFAHNSTLELVSLRTGIVRNLTRGTGPAWSPDGRRIAFIRYVQYRSAFQPSLWVMPSRGGQPRRLARGLKRFAPYVWSPKGRQIAYVRGRSLFVRTLSGPEGHLLVREGGDVRPLVWSPDGRRILYFTLSR